VNPNGKSSNSRLKGNSNQNDADIDSKQDSRENTNIQHDGKSYVDSSTDNMDTEFNNTDYANQLQNQKSSNSVEDENRLNYLRENDDQMSQY